MSEYKKSAFTLIWFIRDCNLPRLLKWVLIMLTSRAREKDGTLIAYPSYERLCLDTGLKRSAVIAAINGTKGRKGRSGAKDVLPVKGLKELGYLKVRHRPGHQSNIFILNYEKLEAESKQTNEEQKAARERNRQDRALQGLEGFEQYPWADDDNAPFVPAGDYCDSNEGGE